MKQILLVTAIIGILASNVLANPGDDIVTRLAKKTFEKEFPQAVAVKWERLPENELYQVRFVYNNQALLSFIHEDGSLLGTARGINRTSLPFMVNETISKRFKDYEVVQIEELTTPSELSYYFTLENEKSRIYLRVFNNGSYQQTNKTKK